MTESSKSPRQIVEKRAYLKPHLRVFGQVKHLAQGPSTGDGDGSSGMRQPVPSDRRLKTRGVLVGQHCLGIGLYLFDYKPEFRDAWGHVRQFGVMADEVEAVMPQAVSVHPSGYKLVDYGLLGIERYPS